MKEAGRELLEIMDKYENISQMITDYGVTREQIRACIRKQTNRG